MTDKKYEIETDDLAQALTRPPMFMGVNMRIFFGNVILCTLICIDAHTFWGVPIFIFFHLVLVRLSIKEPNYFYLRTKTLIKTPPLMNRWYWGGTNSYEPW